MTRAKDELLLTSAADYGTLRSRKVSRFVVEALDLPSPQPVPARSRGAEALRRHQPEPPPVALAEPPLPEGELLRLSFRQLDDYATCPLKYRYVHRLRVPLLVHHRVVYGSAVHRAVQEHFKARLEGRAFAADELVAAFRAAWVSEGFLSREHEERRLAEGDRLLRRFHAQEAAEAWTPTAVEQEFSFVVGGARVQGRYDLVLEQAGRVTILDFKTGDVRGAAEAQRRAEESLQLDVYALAWLRTEARLPDRVELRFLETGLSGNRVPTPERAAATESLILDVAARVRRQQFPATPSLRACSQCAFRDICPHAARRSAGGE
jgi:DNA helicase-2/ATP-dependent DNA helicase PcrA